MSIEKQVAYQNHQSLNSQSYIADWYSVALNKRGTVIDEYQKLDQLQSGKVTEDCA